MEMRLRQSGIKNISDVKTATIEPNGQLGYELIEDAQPLTVGQFRNMINELAWLNVNKVSSADENKPSVQVSETDNLFSEVVNNQHQTEIPKQLQTYKWADTRPAPKKENLFYFHISI
ncbi:YetF domain-containing protein [Geosporobacter ferrireducens]|uniref:YetF domain-containing protein n=1 Tax=Geosporobacter ferrireducens TaxID=1424294 RepID=UPI001F4687CE